MPLRLSGVAVMNGTSGWKSGATRGRTSRGSRRNRGSLDRGMGGTTTRGLVGSDHPLHYIFPTRRAGSKRLQETYVLLLRHAETSAPDVFHGAESDIGLSEWGYRQAALLGDYLKGKGASALYCSAMRRAVDTAGPIGE